MIERFIGTILIAILILSGCSNSRTPKIPTENNSSQSIPDSWHKIETDKFSISFPNKWTADVKNGIVSFYNKNLEIGLVGVLPIIPQSPNSVYLHGKYHVTAKEKIGGFFTTEAYQYKFYTEQALTSTDTTVPKFEDILLFPQNDKSIVYVIDFHTEDTHDNVTIKYVDESTVIEVAKTLTPVQ